MISLMLIPLFLWPITYKNKLTRVLLLISMLALIGVLFIYQNNKGGKLTDYDAYYSLWNYVSNGGWGSRLDGGYESDLGFMLLMRWISLFTKKIEVFLLVIYLLVITFFGLGVQKLSKDFSNINSLLICIYFLYPFIYDLIQIRFLLAYSIVLYAFSFLLVKEEVSKLKYTLLIILASSIHTTSIIYLVFLLYSESKMSRKIGKVIPLLVIMIFMFRNSIINLPIIKILLKGKESYLLIEKDVSIYSGIFITITLMYYIFTTNYVCKELEKKDQSRLNLNILTNINLSMFCLVPFLFQTLDVERIFRPLYIINWIIILGSAKYFKSKIIQFVLIAPIFVFQIVHMFRLGGFIKQMFSNVFS